MECSNFSLIMEHAIAEIKDQTNGWQQLYSYHGSFSATTDKKDPKESFSLAVHYNGRDTTPYRLTIRYYNYDKTGLDTYEKTFLTMKGVIEHLDVCDIDEREKIKTELLRPTSIVYSGYKVYKVHGYKIAEHRFMSLIQTFTGSYVVYDNQRDEPPLEFETLDRLINEVPVWFQPLLVIAGLVNAVITHIY